MSDRGSNSGSRSLRSSQKDTVEYEDVTPGESASQVASTVSRASQAARKAAAEVRARTARRRAAREAHIAAVREEIVVIEAEGEKEALDVGDEVFQEQLRKAESASESRGIRSWAPDGQITEDTEEGRKHRTEAWITDATIQEADWKDGEEAETESHDQVRLREPRPASSRAPSTSQRRSSANSVPRTMERSPGQESRGASRVAESSLASRRRSVRSVDLHPRRRLSEASEIVEGSLISRRRSGESVNVRSSRTSRVASPRKERRTTAYHRWEKPIFTRQLARNSSPVPQEESLTDYAELPPITQRKQEVSLATQYERELPPTTQYERESHRESPLARTRTRPRSFPSPTREIEDFRKNQRSRYSMETPCVHTDPPRAIGSRHEFRQVTEFETPSRDPAAGSYRDARSPRHPSTRVQDTYTKTSSMRSAEHRPRSPYYETSRHEELERRLEPAKEISRVSGTGEKTTGSLEALIGVLQAPKVDLPMFKGDPMQYHIFMRAFDDNVERAISDPSSKLARLVQLCTGEAGRVIRGCTLMRPERGYARARQLLKDRYGDEFVIAELWGQRLLNTSSRMSLREFADELRAGFESLDALNALNELQTQGNLAEIVKKLPAYLQNRWRDVVWRLKTYESRRPDLQDVVEYVEEAAAVASDPVYGSQGQKSERNPASTRAAYATSTCTPCPVCEREGHETLSCEKFSALQPEDRLQTAVRLRLCFVCLKGGHITRDCTSKMRCKMEDCGRMHATILHAANWSKLREQGRRRRERVTSDQRITSDRNREAPAEEPSATGSVYHAQGRENTPRDMTADQETKIALPLVPVRVYSPESKRSHSTYALLDTGSNVTLCHERLLRKLGLQGRAETMSLTTLDKKHNRTPTRVVSLDVTDPDGEGRLHLGQVYARDSLPIDPQNRVTMSEAARWSHLKGLPLHPAPADEVMLLIGQDYPDALIPLATVPGEKGEPYAVKTRLGWTVNGPVSAIKTRGEQQAFFTQSERHEQLD